MRNLITLGLLAGLGFGVAAPAAAEGFDGTTPLLCAAQRAMECPSIGPCQEVTPAQIGAPDFMRIDPGAESVTPLGEDGRTSTIRHLTTVDGKLIVQGAEDGVEGVRDGTGWTLAIDQGNGRLVATAASDAVAFVIFGACTPF